MTHPPEHPDRGKSESVSPLLRLWPLLRRRRGALVAAGVALVAASALTLTLPIALRRVIDHGFLAGAERLIDQYFLALILVVAALAVATATRAYLVLYLGERLIADLRSRLFTHLLDMSPAFFESMRTGEVISRMTADTAVIQSVVGVTVSLALRNLLLLGGGAVMMVVTSPKLAVLALFLVPLVVGPLLLLGRRLRQLARESQDRVAAASGVIGEVLQALPIVQAFTAERESAERGVEAVEDSFDAARRRVAARARLTALVIFLVSGGVVGVVWVGATDVSAGRMSPGELGQFVFYAIFVGGSAAGLSEVWSALQLAAGSTERIFELLDSPREIRAPARPVPAPRPARGEILFENVTFRYPQRPDVLALDGFTLSVRPGQRVALVGPSGAGKTTVLQLLLRQYDPQDGVVRFDGVDLRAFDPVELRRQFALVPQEPAIFARSAAANISLGKLEATSRDIEAAARDAAAHEFIAGLPRGYETWLGERGVLLSGGQNQRIAIARAMLRDAPVLLLDEATSALDAESEREVQRAIGRLAEGRTMLVIAHRLATVKSADRIIVMERGRVVGDGAHDELVAEGGLYARFARLQFGTADA